MIERRQQPPRSGEQWIKMPLEPAAPWLALGSVSRVIGCDLYRVYQARPIEGVRLVGIEDVIVRMLAPDPSERKLIRCAIRKIIDAGLIIDTAEGCVLLYSRDAYRHHKVSASCTDGAAKVSQGAAMVPASSLDHSVSVQANPLESHDGNLQIEREKDRERDTRAPARMESDPGDAEREPGEPPPSEPLVALIRREYAVAYTAKLAASPPETASLARAVIVLAAWCEANAGPLGRAAAELAAAVLSGLFASERAAAKRWPLAWAAHDPLEFVSGAKLRPSEPADVLAKRARAAEMVAEIDRIERMESFERTSADLDRKNQLARELAKLTAALPRQEAA